MSNSEFHLSSSTRALSTSSSAAHLIEQKERIEHAMVEGDTALVLDTSKAFLESLFKTILSDRVEAPDLTQDMSPLYKAVRDILPLNNDAQACEIIKRLTNSIVHNVGELRNRFGAASHGDDGYFENPIDISEAEMIAHVVDGMAGFLYRKHKTHGNPELAARIYHRDYAGFNDYLDGQREGYRIVLDEERAIDLSPSYLLFAADEEAYRELLIQFLAAEKEDLDDSLPLPVDAPKEVQQDLPIDGSEMVDIVSLEEGARLVKQSMLVEGLDQDSVADTDLIQLSEFITDYAKNKAGIDWQNRESLKASFRTIIRRKLMSIAFPDEYLNIALDAVIQKTAELYPSRMGTS